MTPISRSVGFKLKESKTDVEVRELLVLEQSVSLSRKVYRGGLDMSESKGDADWVEWCMTIDVNGNCVKEHMKSLGMSQEDAQFGSKWRRRVNGITA